MNHHQGIPVLNSIAIDRGGFWQASPYPNIALDAFFSQTQFVALAESMRNVYEKSKASHTYNTDIERNKQCFNHNSFDENIWEAVKALSSTEFLAALEDLLEVRGLIPLTAIRSLSGRSYFHVSSRHGILGSHVDESYVGRRWFRRWIFNKKIHVLSCVYYGSPEWEAADGGHLILFDSTGENAVAQLECRPNRLNLFLHTSKSFHGVSELASNRKRYSIYMDYYLPEDALPSLKESIVRNQAKCSPDFWMHGVTFFPISSHLIYKKIHRQYLRQASKPL